MLFSKENFWLGKVLEDDNWNRDDVDPSPDSPDSPDIFYCNKEGAIRSKDLFWFVITLSSFFYVLFSKENFWLR